MRISYSSNQYTFIGLSIWHYIDNEIGELRECFYGMTAYQVRVLQYNNWIKNTIKEGVIIRNVVDGLTI